MGVTGPTGTEIIDVVPDPALTPQSDAKLVVHRPDGTCQGGHRHLRIDTPIEVDYYRAGGILPFRAAPVVAGAEQG